MKYLFVLFFVFSLGLTTAYPSSFFIAGSKVNVITKWNHPLKARCEKVEGEPCYLIPKGYNLNYYKLGDGAIIEDIVAKQAYLAALLEDKTAKDGALEDMLKTDPVKKGKVLDMMIKAFMSQKGLVPGDI